MRVMGDYIEAGKILEYLDAMISALSYPLSVAGEEAKAYVEGFKEAWSVVERFPTADVAPVVHGRWVPFHSHAAGDIWYCSACEVGFAARLEYCPHCGARMDLEGTDG